MKYNFYTATSGKRTIESKLPLSLQALQLLVEGNIESVQLKNGNCLFVNEEGLVNDLPVNPFFTQEDTDVDITTYGLRGNAIEGKLDERGEFIGV